MAIEERLGEELKQAMRSKDQRTLDVIRMIKSKIAERRTAKGATPVDEAAVQEVVASYRKQMQKAVEEYAKLGEKGAAQVEQLRFEIEYCSKFLPATMDESALRTLVAERIASLGVTDPKQVGRLVGDVMKTHKGQVEAGDVKRVAEAILAGG
ncbi:MAG: GatB/YqeY domain-containing protein [Alphaproteobacteria bacterium]